MSSTAQSLSMSSFADPRARFATDSVATMSGPRVVVMCFDRLDRDLAAAIEALTTGDLYVVNTALGHAQALVHELAGMLDLEAWTHAGTLASIYDYVIRVLVSANTTKKISKVEEARRILAEIGDAFRRAAQDSTGHAAVAGRPASAEADPAGGFSAQA